MARPRKYSDPEIIAALTEMKGMVYLAAQKIGCEANTIYNRAKKSKAVAAVMAAERGKVVDTAELRLFKAILDGEQWAVRLALMTLGKNRGYVERQEVKSVSDEDLNAAIEAELARVAGGRPAADARTAGEDADEDDE